MNSPLYIAGPTGTGKSGVALALAGHLGNTDIVNADAFQVYEGLDILTAKPTPAERARVPHHLFSFVPLESEFSVARYHERARKIIASIAENGRLPLVTGGTGLYIKALTHGLSSLPEADPFLRAELENLPPDRLVAWLEKLDPEGAARTNLANRRYVQRALEITLQTGRPMSAVKTDWNRSENAHPHRGVILLREREDLYARIDRRVHAMIAGGLLDEVRALGNVSDTAEKAIGIREVRCHLSGEISLDECIAAIQQASRRYAKRQITWFKKEKAFKTVCLSRGEDATSACARIIALFPELQGNTQ